MNNTLFLRELFFWSVWLIIPLLWETLIGLLGALCCLVKLVNKKEQLIEYYPYVSIIVPIYNSSKTLEMCLDSIRKQNYPLHKIEVLLIDNGSTDNSHEIFKKIQKNYPYFNIRWDFSENGKSKALNKGIFQSAGKYIINIDSDGWLDKNAVKNVVSKFQKNNKICALTGVVLTDLNLIENTKSKMLKIIQKCELFEYVETFLIGRNHQSLFNSMYTLAGAFSCFKREALLKTHMYNFETVGEDTHMTYQIKKCSKGSVELCEDAFFYVDPIEGLNNLYIQRQRWQRGQIEVASIYKEDHTGGINGFIKKFSMRIIINDHTLIFPRLIWFFGMIYLYFINYPLKLLIGANILLHLLYVINSLIYFLISKLYLKTQNPVKTYLNRNFYITFIIPVYRFIVFWIRMAGIINSIESKSKWNTQTFTEEISITTDEISNSIKQKTTFLNKIKRVINYE